jgi:hypothetical protein
VNHVVQIVTDDDQLLIEIDAPDDNPIRLLFNEPLDTPLGKALDTLLSRKATVRLNGARVVFEVVGSWDNKEAMVACRIRIDRK